MCKDIPTPESTFPAKPRVEQVTLLGFESDGLGIGPDMLHPPKWVDHGQLEDTETPGNLDVFPLNLLLDRLVGEFLLVCVGTFELFATDFATWMRHDKLIDIKKEPA